MKDKEIKKQKINIFKKALYIVTTHLVSKKGLIFAMATTFLCLDRMDGWEWLALAVIALVGISADKHAKVKQSDWELITKLGWVDYTKLKIDQMFEFGPFILVATTTVMFMTGQVSSEIWVSASGVYIGINIFDSIRGKFDGFSNAYQLINKNRDAASGNSTKSTPVESQRRL